MASTDVSAGGCLCGAIRYAFSGEPALVAVCHCRNCQKQSGSAFSIVAAVPPCRFRSAGAAQGLSRQERNRPGPIATNLSATWEPPCDEAGNPLSAEQALAAWPRLIPMGRLGATPDVAPMIGFLASDGAGFVTGAEFIVDGGYTAA